MDMQRERERILQTKSIEELHRPRNVLEMVTVYKKEPHAWYDEITTHDLYCALIPSSQVEQILFNVNWDLDYGSGGPCTATYLRSETKNVKYLRFENDKGIEPLLVNFLIYGRQNNDVHVDIAEEFRLFHGLYYDREKGRYIKVDEEGEEHIIAVIKPHEIKIRLKEIRQFLAIKEMHLSIQFCYVECSACTLEELELVESENDQRNGLCCWNFHCVDRQIIGQKGICSRLLGKRLIEPFPKSKSGFRGFSEEPKKYESFIICVADNGDEITYTCNPDALANYFGKNREAPNYLTPVSFNKGVLDRYYSRPGKYKVEDSILRCDSLRWRIYIDNHHDDKVCAWLGDLGHLPYSEQRHWRIHNIPSTTGVSETYFHRQLFATATDSNRPEHIFQIRYQKLLETCQYHLGWRLLLPLARNDHYHLQNIRVPSSNEQKDFDELVLSLTKVLIDSINEKKLKELIPDEERQHRGSIYRLEALLNDRKAPDASYHIEFLRKLQNLRSSGSSHRKSSNYEKALGNFKADSDDLRAVFEKILRESIEFLNYLIDLVETDQFHET